MSYQNNPYGNYPNYDPWNQNEYRTGSTKPPKRHRGLIAVLLVLVILLSGILSILGVMNVRLFQKLNALDADQTLPIMFSNTNEDPAPTLHSSQEAAVPSETGEASLPVIDTQTTPTSAENIPVAGALSLQAIYEKIIPSVVSISSYYQRGTSTGTGVIISEDGYIVTNSHVVEGAEAFEVLLSDGRNIEAVLIGTDDTSDLAVLRIEGENLVAAPFGDSSVLRVGDTVVAIGDPLGLELRGTMTDGIVSAINRDIELDGRTMSLIQTNAALNSGNSGGPLINCYGQVIGINTMKMGDSMSTAGVEGLGFAIPSNTVTDIVNQLIENGYVSGRPSLGITGEGISSFYQFYYRLPQGLHITNVKKGSSADLVGIQAGDILMSLDGIAITSSDALKTALYAYEPGDAVQAIIYRAGKQYAVTLTVGEANG